MLNHQITNASTKKSDFKVALNECWTNEFDIKEFGKLKYYLGINVAHSEQREFISQHKNITDFLNKTGK